MHADFCTYIASGCKSDVVDQERGDVSSICLLKVNKAMFWVESTNMIDKPPQDERIHLLFINFMVTLQAKPI